MARPRRIDFPGAVFHVANRSLPGRRLAEDVRDARYLLSRVARVVRSGFLDVHAFSIRPDAYDLLVTSRDGRLAEAMRWTQDLHARAWNRRRGTTGPLFRGRYRAKLLPSRIHRRAVLDYVEYAAVRMGLVARADAWPFSSAAGEGRAWVARELGGHVLARDAPMPVVAWDLVARWLRHREKGPHDLDGLVWASESQVVGWLVRRASCASVPGLVIVRPQTLIDACAGVVDESGAAGLLSLTCGLSLVQIADRLGIAKATAHGRVHAFTRGIREGTGRVRRRAARVFRQALAVEYGRVRDLLAGEGPVDRAREAVG